MSTGSIKKVLLAGTALVAAMAWTTQSYAQVVLTGNVVWGETAAGTNGSLGPGVGAGDSVSLGGHMLTITNDQTANDGSANKNTFTLGAIDNNGAGATGAINITQAAAGTGGTLTVGINSITNTGTGVSTLTINSNDAADQSVAVTVGANGLAIGGNLTVNNNDITSTGQTVNLTVAGASSVTGQLLVTAGTGVNDSVTITNTGDAVYTGGVGLAAGTGAGANATLNLNGPLNTLTGVVDLIDAGTATVDSNGNIVSGQAVLNFGPGTSTTTVTAGINGNALNEGTVNLLGSNTLNGTIGAIHPIYALTGGVEGTNSTISGSVASGAILVFGETDGTAGAVTFGSTVAATGLEVVSAGTTTAQAESATITGNATVSGVTRVISGSFTGANATLNLNGASNTLTGVVTLADTGTGTSGAQAVLDFGVGVTTTTVTAGITGFGANQGTVNLLGSNTITGAIGTTNAVNTVNAGVEGTTSTITGAVNANTVNVNGAIDAAATGAVTFGSTLTVGTGGMRVSSADTTTHAQVENATVTGAFTDTGALHVTAGTTAGANASLALNGASNTITGVTTLTDVTGGGNATLTLAAGSSTTFTGGVVGGTSGQGTLALAGAATVNGNIGKSTDTIKAVTLAGGATDAFSGSIFATTLAYGASNSTVQMADNQNINAAITATNTGTLSFAGASTVTGQVGAAGNVLSTINAGAVVNKTDTFNNAVFAGTVNVGPGNVDLKGNTSGNIAFSSPTGLATLESGKTFTGNINGNAAGDGNLTLAGGNTITGQIGNTGLLNNLTLSGTGTTVTVASAAITVNAANTTNLGSNTLALGNNNFTVGAGQTLAVTINSPSVFGGVTTTGATTIDSAAKLNLTISPTVYLPTTTFILASGTGGGVATLAAGGLTVNGINDGASTTLTEGVITYSQVANANSLEFQAHNNGAVSVASTSNNASVAAAMDQIGSTGNAALQQVQSNIVGATSAAAVNNILSSLTPTVNGGSQMATMEVNTEVQDIADTRMAALRDGDGSSGVSSGSSSNGVGLWVQGYGQNATQSDRDSVAGYHASTWGSAIGADSQNIIDNGVLGLAINYGKATVTSKDINATKTDVDNYGLMIYGSLGLPNDEYVDGQVGYAYNKINNVRHDVGGVAGADASGSTNSDQFDMRATFGSEYIAAILGDAVVTPNASASYTYLSTQGYTETGSGANLNVGSNSQNNLSIGIGDKISWTFKNADGSVLKPVLRANYSYAVLDDRVDTTASFIGAAAGNSPSFTTQGPSPERNRFDFGGGVTWMTTGNWDLSANYNYEYRTDYTANTGTLRATAHF